MANVFGIFEQLKGLLNHLLSYGRLLGYGHGSTNYTTLLEFYHAREGCTESITAWPLLKTRVCNHAAPWGNSHWQRTVCGVQ